MTDSPTTNDVGDPVNRPGATEIEYEIGDDELPSGAVVRATAALTDTPVLDLEPLYGMLDPDHLDGLFGDSTDMSISENASMSFTFNECHVSVTSDIVIVRTSD